MEQVSKLLPTAFAGGAGVGIIYVGSRFLLNPQRAAHDFGVAVSPADVGPYLAIKGVRDITSGLVLLAVLATGQRGAQGWALRAAAFTPVADTLIVLRHAGAPAVAFGIHDLTAALLLADAAVLIRQASRR
jgi:hypothetical protein